MIQREKCPSNVDFVKNCSFPMKVGKNMRKHMTIHTGVRPFKCETCMKAFRTKVTFIFQ